MIRAMSQDAWSNTIAERNYILCESSSYCVCCIVGVFIIYVPVTSGLLSKKSRAFRYFEKI